MMMMMMMMMMVGITVSSWFFLYLCLYLESYVARFCRYSHIHEILFGIWACSMQFIRYHSRP